MTASEKGPSATGDARPSTWLTRGWCRLVHGRRSLVWEHNARYLPSGVRETCVVAHYCGICNRSRLTKGSDHA